MNEPIDFYRGTHRAYWDKDHVIRHVRVHQPVVKAASRAREFLQAILVALVILAVATADSLERDQQIALAIGLFVWAVAYGAVMYWEHRS